MERFANFRRCARSHFVEDFFVKLFVSSRNSFERRFDEFAQYFFICLLDRLNLHDFP